MKVSLLASTPDALRVAFTAIRTCYSPYEQEHIFNDDWNKYKDNNDDHLRLVKQIVSHGHTSTLEHISFTLAITGVSRTLLAQLTRHRIGISYSVQSQRYVKLSSESKSEGFDYMVPSKIQDNEEALNKYNKFMNHTQEVYDRLISLGIKAEDARYILPNATETNITLTCNLRAFIDLYSKRNNTTHSQKEISDLVELMKEVIVETEPWVEEIL